MGREISSGNWPSPPPFEPTVSGTGNRTNCRGLQNRAITGPGDSGGRVMRAGKPVEMSGSTAHHACRLGEGADVRILKLGITSKKKQEMVRDSCASFPSPNHTRRVCLNSYQTPLLDRRSRGSRRRSPDVPGKRQGLAYPGQNHRFRDRLDKF